VELQDTLFQAEDILSELIAREMESLSTSNVLRDCFPEQLSFIRDLAPLKGAFCTRRAAKSYSAALDIINDSESYPRAHYLILGLNRQEMKDIWWDPILKAISDRYRLNAVFNETELTMRMANGALIRIAGADANEQEKRKFLGGKKRKIVIDEAQSWGTDLEQLIFAVLKPSVADYRGQIIVVGTPGNLTQGFFAKLTNGCRAGMLSPPETREPGWSIHTWNTFQNTAVVDLKSGERMCDRWKQEIDDLKVQKGPLVTKTSWFRQMYMGEWVVEQDKLVYKFLPSVNEFEKLPKLSGSWHYTLGIDLGHEDASAFVVTAYNDHDPCLYVLEAWQKSGMDFTDVATRIRGYQEKYDFDSLIVDGANKQGVEEMKRRHSLPLICAEKAGKFDFIDLMNADFVLERVKLKKGSCEPLVVQYGTLLKNPKNTREEHPGLPNHSCDAALYAWRHTYAFLSQVPVAPPAPGTPEFAAKEAQEMEERHISKLQAEQDAFELGHDQLDSSNWETLFGVGS
jgi:hypothetical protein